MTTLKIGDKAPNFSANDQDGNLHTLENYKGKKLVVFFYPKANTPGCTAEACDLRDNFERFQASNYALLGVSADNAKAQSNFKNKFSFPFPLLADEDKSVIQDFGVWGPKKFMGKEYDGIHRTTFIIDESGIIVDIISEVKTKWGAGMNLSNSNLSTYLEASYKPSASTVTIFSVFQMKVHIDAQGNFTTEY
jgi:peroxiredoxin Q/BCP